MTQLGRLARSELRRRILDVLSREGIVRDGRCALCRGRRVGNVIQHFSRLHRREVERAFRRALLEMLDEHGFMPVSAFTNHYYNMLMDARDEGLVSVVDIGRGRSVVLRKR